MKYLDVPQSGSRANVVASRNRFGQYYRTRAIPTQPRTAKQQDNRATFGNLATYWSQTLTDGQRILWRNWADTHPVVNSLGVTVVLTGLQAFISVNQFLQRLAQAIVATPPVGADFSTPLVTSLTVTATASVYSLVHGAIASPANYLVFAGPPRKAGVTFESAYRIVTAGPGVGAAGTQTASAAYVATWGALTGKAGYKIFTRIYDFDSTGNRGTTYEFTSTIA